jgi:hypothetical protein
MESSIPTKGSTLQIGSSSPRLWPSPVPEAKTETLKQEANKTDKKTVRKTFNLFIIISPFITRR